MTSSAQIEVPSVWGEPNISTDGVLKTAKHKKYFEVRTAPLNFTSQDLTIGYRNGLKINLPKQWDPDHQSQLVVRTELIISNLVEINLNHLLSVVDEQCSSEMKLIKAKIQLPDSSNPYRREFESTIITLDYSISIPELKSFGGSVYFHDLDLMISQLPVEEAPDHPYSERGMARQQCIDVNRHHNRFGFSIEIVDNQGAIGERYINVGGQVSRIPATVNFKKMDGIYISWNQSVKGRLDKPDTQVRCFEPAIADAEFRLFKTYGEALSYGNGDEARKKELADIEFQTASIKARAAAEKAELDRKNQQLDFDLKQLQHQFDMLKAERDEILSQQSHRMEIEKQKIRDYYESRSYDRKDSSEVVKFLPAIITGVGAIILAIKAFF